MNENIQQQKQEYSGTTAGSQTQHKQDHPKRFVIVVLVSLFTCALLIVIFCSIFTNAHTIDPFSYLTVSFTGYDGYGNAVCRLDKNAIVQQIIGPIPESGNMSELKTWVSLREEYKDSIRLSCSQYSGLFNHDRVLITIQVSEFAADRIQGGQYEFEVEGLTALQEVDVFADLEVLFEGISGEATAQCVKADGNAILKVCTLSLSQERNLCTGDTVTVSITNADELASSHGYRLLTTEKEYTVPSLPEYLTRPEQVSSENIRQIAEQLIADEKAGFIYDMGLSYSEPVYYGTYICVAKPDAMFVEHNSVLQIYITYDEYMDGEYRRTIYLPIQFYDLVVEPGGMVSFTYEDGQTSIFATDIEKELLRLSEKYDTYEITFK